MSGTDPRRVAGMTQLKNAKYGARSMVTVINVIGPLTVPLAQNSDSAGSSRNSFWET